MSLGLYLGFPFKPVTALVRASSYGFVKGARCPKGPGVSPELSLSRRGMPLPSVTGVWASGPLTWALSPQTIKCLLIHPNPESALNEEAGRLLLENYEEYAARARLLTEIHGGAGGPSGGRPEASRSLASAASASSTDPLAPGGPGGAEGPMAKKHAGERDKKLAAKKKTDKKRALRRL